MAKKYKYVKEECGDGYIPCKGDCFSYEKGVCWGQVTTISHTYHLHACMGHKETPFLPKPKTGPWFGFDLDASIAYYNGWTGSHVIGEPIPKAIEKIKSLLATGKRVKIFTARLLIRQPFHT